MCLQRAWSGLEVIFYHSYRGWMLMEVGKGEVGKCYVVTQPSACHTTWSVLGTHCGATVLPAPRFPQKIYPKATIEPEAHKWEHYVLLYLFYLNELIQWSQLRVLRMARVIFVLLLKTCDWSATFSQHEPNLNLWLWTNSNFGVQKNKELKMSQASIIEIPDTNTPEREGIHV